ncbi:MAG: hypothetical protein KDD89_01280 [Anaerolineales bacterium]|nr:hypothetical protein [Anaerolineales bacterium]
MGFLKRLFGGGEDRPQKYVDKDGIYFYVRATRCNAVVKVRADKKHDLNNVDGGYVWHKTIVDSKCFSRMHAEVHFDRNFNVTNQEISDGEFITEEAYEAALAEEKAAKQAALAVQEESETDTAVSD